MKYLFSWSCAIGPQTIFGNSYAESDKLTPRLVETLRGGVRKMVCEQAVKAGQVGIPVAIPTILNVIPVEEDAVIIPSRN